MSDLGFDGVPPPFLADEPASENERNRRYKEVLAKLHMADSNDHVATVSEPYMSRYTIEWNGVALPVGTRLYAQPAAVKQDLTTAQGDDEPDVCPTCGESDADHSECAPEPDGIYPAGYRKPHPSTDDIPGARTVQGSTATHAYYEQPEAKAGADENCGNCGRPFCHERPVMACACARLVMKPKPAEGGAVKARIDEIEYAISCKGMTAHQVFTQMKQLIRPAPAAATRADVEVLANLIRDDSYAMTFQTMGQYRTALLREARRLAGKGE